MARILTGVVTSDKPDKTVIISVSTRKTHPLYKKQFTVGSKFMVHDEKNQAKVGDLITAVETKPLSARKRFSLTKVVQRAGVHFEETDATADVPVDEITAKEEPVIKTKPKTAEKPAKKAEPKEKAE